MCVREYRSKCSADIPVRFYADTFDRTGSDMGFYNAEMAGRVISNKKIVFSAYLGAFRPDLAAWSPDAIVENPAPTEYWFWGSGQPAIYSRRRTGQLSGTWKLTEGSSVLTYVGGTPGYQLAPGAAMTGEGIPEGIYLRRIFSDTIVEMSAPATANADESSVTFAPFAAETHQTLKRLEKGQGGNALWLNKHTNDDVLTLDIMNLESGRDDDTQYVVTINTKSGYVPGLLKLHNTMKCRNWLKITNGHVAFYATNDLHQAGIRRMSLAAKTYTGRITVPEAETTAGIEHLVMKGIITKDGPGTLDVTNVDEPAFNVVNVDDGTFAVTSEIDMDVTNLTIAAGAKFVKRGTGKLTLVNFSTPGAISVEGGEIAYNGDMTGGKALADGVKIIPAVDENGNVITVLKATGAIALQSGKIVISSAVAAKMKYGTYTLISGSSLTRNGGWTVECEDTHRRFSLITTGDSLQLRYSEPGTCVIIR